MSKPREFRKYDLDAFMPSMNEMADKFVLDNVECDSNIKTQEEKEWAKIIRGAVRVAFISGYNSREKEFDAWKVGHLKQATDFLEISNKQQSEIETLTAKVKRYEDAMVHIHKMGCAYKGNLTGCPACYICNEFPEFNEMNKRDRSEHGNN